MRSASFPRGWRQAALSAALSCALSGCVDSSAQTASRPPPTGGHPTPAAPPAGALVSSARKQIGVTVHYDPAYVRIAYPGGDVPVSRGVCTDVVIRAFRTQGMDLQRLVHEDMRAHFPKYPQNWGLRAPDRNIDHRRVPNLQTWFTRQGWSVAVTDRAEHYRAGDLVTWMLPGNLPHIGIVGDRRAASGDVPLIIHNIGRGAREENILFAYRITGHYRPRLRPVVQAPSDHAASAR